MTVNWKATIALLALPAALLATFYTAKALAPEPPATVEALCKDFHEHAKAWAKEHKQAMLDSGFMVQFKCLQEVEEDAAPATAPAPAGKFERQA